MSSTKKSTKYFKLNKKERNISYIVANKEALFRAEKRKKNITKHIEVKELRSLERVCIENS